MGTPFSISIRLYFVFAITLLPSIRTDELIEINVWNVPQRFFHHRPVGKRINPPEQSLRVDFLANFVEKRLDIHSREKISLIAGRFDPVSIPPTDVWRGLFEPLPCHGWKVYEVIKPDQPDKQMSLPERIVNCGE